jgi:bifunctional non-homologous end joining protein LigD
VYEEKVDGYRMLAFKDADRVRLASRQGVDHTRRFPDIAAALLALEVPTLILDGEIAVFDQKLISRFEWLRRRAPAEICTPPLFMAFDCLYHRPLFMAFDCLYHRGKDLRDRPLYVRRNVIEGILDDQDRLFPVRRLADDGLKAWQQVLERGYEGMVAKDPTSAYRGGRTLSWLKVKQPRYREGERGWHR